MDDLIEMKDLRPRLEKELRLPNDARGARNRVYYFSIDGTLRGNRLTHCLMAGECIMVQSDRGFEHALKIAKDGLHDTVELAREFFEEQTRSRVVVSPYDHSHIMVDVGGRGCQAPGNLASDQKLRDMIAHIIGGKPWRP